MYLLDTNVVSELRRPKPHGGVLAWFASTGQAKLYMSAVTVGEIQIGVERTREQDPQKAQAIETWLNAVVNGYDVLAMTPVCFRQWAKLMHRQSSTRAADAMIAATALAHGLTIVTRNVSDFAHFDCPLVNPFSSLDT